MKNKAFTMAEALIVLSLVSVLAGLSVTAISNTKPDESIVKFRKAYATTARIANDLINDEELYPHAKEPYATMTNLLVAVNNIKGLRDDAVTSDMIAKYPFLTNNTQKFWEIFRFKTNSVDVSNQNAYGTGDNNHAFTSPDGITYYVHDFYSGAWGPGGQVATIWIYTHDNSGTACEYNASTCRVPTKFHLNLYYDGEIRTNDPMSCSYLRYPNINKASKIPTDPSVNTCFAN